MRPVAAGQFHRARQRFAALCLAGVLSLPAAYAAEISVEVPLEAGAPAISWSALPLDGLAAEPVLAPGPAAGPWRADLSPGAWLISGLSGDGRSFEMVVTIGAEAPQRLIVPEVEPPVDAAFACAGPKNCDFTDDATGLSFTLPEHWGAESPFLADPPEGGAAPVPSGGFFEMTTEGGAYWALNPPDWIAGETGPCETVAVGLLCTFEDTPAARAALAVIGPSLSWQQP